MAIFQDNLGKPVPERFHSGFYWIKDDGGGGDIQSCKMLSSSQIIATNKQTTAFLSPNQQYHNQNTEGKMYHIPQTCSSKLTWQFPSFSWPSKAPQSSLPWEKVAEHFISPEADKIALSLPNYQTQSGKIPKQICSSETACKTVVYAFLSAFFSHFHLDLNSYSVSYFVLN